MWCITLIFVDIEAPLGWILSRYSKTQEAYSFVSKLSVLNVPCDLERMSFVYLLGAMFCCGASHVAQSACQCRRCKRAGSIPESGRKRKWQPTPVFLSGKFHGQPGGLQSMELQRVRHEWETEHTYAHRFCCGLPRCCGKESAFQSWRWGDIHVQSLGWEDPLEE